jgi:predicted PurR-regulated permease PerM
MKMQNRIEQMMAIASVVFLVVGCFMVLRTFVTSLAWAAILCYSTWPIYNWIEHRLNRRRNLAATVMTVLIVAVVVVPFLFVGFRLADSIAQTVSLVQGWFRDGVPAPPEWIGNLPFLGKSLHAYWLSLSHDSVKTAALFKESFSRSQGWLVNRGLDFGQGILHLTLSVFIAFFFYRDGIAVVSRLNHAVKRIAGHRTQHLLTLVGGTVKSVVYGILGTALAQGTLAGIGFYFAGIPFPVLLGLATFFMSLIPAGPPFVWLPATVWLFYQGKVGWGIFMLIWGMFVISGVDNLLKPYLISRGSNLPFILVFLGVLGGMLGFGFIGVFLGPTLLAVGYSLLQEWSSAEVERA